MRCRFTSSPADSVFAVFSKSLLIPAKVLDFKQVFAVITSDSITEDNRKTYRQQLLQKFSLSSVFLAPSTQAT